MTTIDMFFATFFQIAFSALVLHALKQKTQRTYMQ